MEKTLYFPYFADKVKEAEINVNNATDVICYIIEELDFDFINSLCVWADNIGDDLLMGTSKELESAFVAFANGQRPDFPDLEGCRALEDELCVIFQAIEQWAFDGYQPEFPLVLI